MKAVTGKDIQCPDMCNIKQQGKGGTFKCFCPSVRSLKSVRVSEQESWVSDNEPAVIRISDAVEGG